MYSLLGNAVSVYSLFCSIACRDIYTVYCTHPRATLGIHILSWYREYNPVTNMHRLVTSLALGVNPERLWDKSSIRYWG